jgi:hypothetical protein
MSWGSELWVSCYKYNDEDKNGNIEIFTKIATSESKIQYDFALPRINFCDRY